MGRKKYTRSKKITTKTAISKSELRKAQRREDNQINKAISTTRVANVVSVKPTVLEETNVNADAIMDQVTTMYFVDNKPINDIASLVGANDEEVLEIIICKEYENMSIDKLAKKYSLSNKKVDSILIKHNIPKRKRGTRANTNKMEVLVKDAAVNNVVEEKEVKEEKVLGFTFADHLFENKNFRAVNIEDIGENVVQAGLVKDRHEIRGIDKYIFDNISDSDFQNPKRLESVVIDFVADNFNMNNSSSNTLILYCTGLQIALSTVMSVCSQFKINIITMHYDAKTTGYTPYETLCIFGSHPKVEQISAFRNIANIAEMYNTVYTYNCGINDLINQQNNIYISCNFGSRGDSNNNNTIIIFNKEYPDTEVWELFGDIIKHMQGDIYPKKHNVMLGRLDISISGYKYGEVVAKSYNYSRTQSSNVY